MEAILNEACYDEMVTGQRWLNKNGQQVFYITINK